MEAENTEIRSSCPLCSAVLKFRNASFVERPFRCPECQGRLRLVQGLENFYHVVVVDDPSPSARKDLETSRNSEKQTTPPDRKLSSRKPKKADKLLRLLKSPVGIAWSVALGGFAILLIFIIPHPKESPSETKVANENESTEPSKIENTKGLPPENKPSVALKPVVKFPPVAAKPQPKKKPKQKIVTAKKNKKVKKEKTSPNLPLVAPRPRPARPEIVIPLQQYHPEDFEKAFAQKIKRFEQLEPIPARLLFEELEEMAAIPIRFDPPELADARGILDRKLKLQLIGTNVGEILKAVLKNLSLDMKTDEKGILIVKKREK